MIKNDEILMYFLLVSFYGLSKKNRIVVRVLCS